MLGVNKRDGDLVWIAMCEELQDYKFGNYDCHYTDHDENGRVIAEGTFRCRAGSIFTPGHERQVSYKRAQENFADAPPDEIQAMYDKAFCNGWTEYMRGLGDLYFDKTGRDLSEPIFVKFEV